MMKQQPLCLKGVTPTTLSNWRDQELATTDANMLMAHVPTCRFCQATLAEFTAVATTLQGQRLPMPDGRLWRGVRDGIARRGHAPKLPTFQRAVLAGVGAAAVLILVLVFALLHVYTPEKPPVSVAATATVTSTPTGTSGTPTATGTPSVKQGQTAPATWSIGTLPAGFAFHDTNGAPLPSAFQVNGTTAYACVGNKFQTDHIVVSHDRGQHWAASASLPAGVTSCNDLVVATNDPAVIVLNGGLQGTSYFSSDSGATWQSAGTADIQTVTMFNGAIYAILTDPSNKHSALAFAATSPSAKDTSSRHPLTANSSCPCSYPSLVVSHDHLKTWQIIDAGVLPGDSAKSIAQFWLNPVNGSLLVQEFKGTGWLSNDDGQQWTKLNFPPGSLNGGTFVVQTPTRAQPWRLCFLNSCSADSGASWQPVPSGATPFAIGADGTLYAGPESTNGLHFYVLPPGATQWVLSSAAPFSLPANAYTITRYSPATTGDILWMFLVGGQNQPTVKPSYVTIAFT